jgi:hypothetical protein
MVGGTRNGREEIMVEPPCICSLSTGQAWSWKNQGGNGSLCFYCLPDPPPAVNQKIKYLAIYF